MPDKSSMDLGERIVVAFVAAVIITKYPSVACWWREASPSRKGG